MLETLSDRLQSALSDVRSRGKLTEDDVAKAMRQVRLALLEADVNFQVVKDFTARVGERARGAEVLEALNPGQQVVKLVGDELTALMGGSARDLAFAGRPPTIVLMAGLQGSGKTTACAKLARYLREEHGKDVALAACDTYRPAAVEQLVKVGSAARATVYERGTEPDPVDIAAWAVDQARAEARDVLIVDTSGRLHVDDELMEELARIRKRIKPHDVLLVVDAMTGQDAVNVAEAFASAAEFDGVVLTKLDGDARGGAALSVKAVTGKPILYASTGEKLDAFERFHPDRMSQRILGMGDVMTLIEKAEREFDDEQAAELEQKIRKQQFTLDEAGPAHGAAVRAAEDAARRQRPGARRPQGRRPRPRPPPGDHHVDDPRGARAPRDPERLAQAPDRAWIGHHGAGGQPARQAVRADAEGDAPAPAGEDAVALAARRRAVTPPPCR